MRRAFATTTLALLLLAASCGGGEVRSSDPNGQPAVSTIVACIRGGDVTDLPPGLAANGLTEDTVVVVQGSDAALRSLRPPWLLVVRFGSPAAYAKVRNPRVVVGAPAEGFEALLKLSPKGNELEDDALKTLLAGSRFRMATRSGDIATGHASLETLDALLALEEIESLRAAVRVRQRSEPGAGGGDGGPGGGAGGSGGEGGGAPR